MSAKTKVIELKPFTNSDLHKFGPSFARAFPLQDERCFADLILEIDKAVSTHQQRVVRKAK